MIILVKMHKNIKMLSFSFKDCFTTWSRRINSVQDRREGLINYFVTNFDITEKNVKSIISRCPTLLNTDITQLDETLKTFLGFGVSKEELITCPRVLNVHPKTVVNKWTVLKECKIKKITLHEIRRFATIHRLYSIKDLCEKDLLAIDQCLYTDLVNCFKYWPDVHKKMLNEPIVVDPEKTLFNIRKQVLEKFLHTHLNCPSEQFEYILNLYPAVRNKSFASLTEIISLLEKMNFSKENISSYGYMLLLDTSNIHELISKVKELGGLKTQVVLQKYPAIMKNSCQQILEILTMLKNEGISDEQQRKCLLVYSLKANTVLERLNDLKLYHEFQGFENHPRIMSFLYNRRKIGERVVQLNDKNKRYISLHKLMSGQKEFDRFVNNRFPQQAGAADIIHFLTQKFTPMFKKQHIKKLLPMHPYWAFTPLTEIVEVMKYLEKYFTIHDLFYNCHLCLYPLKNVKEILETLLEIRKGDITLISEFSSNYTVDLGGVNLEKITDIQLLSLASYFLEKYYHFSGDGVWMKSMVQPVHV